MADQSDGRTAPGRTQLDPYQLDVLRRYATGDQSISIAALTGYDHEFVINVIRMHAGHSRPRAQELVDEHVCCAGEPLNGDPQGLGDAQVDKPPAAEAPGAPGVVVLASYPAWSCLTCGSRFLEVGRSCCSPLAAVTVTITLREVADA